MHNLTTSWLRKSEAKFQEAYKGRSLTLSSSSQKVQVNQSAFQAVQQVLFGIDKYRDMEDSMEAAAKTIDAIFKDFSNK